MPKGSEELTNARKEEIIAACAKLYESMSFKDISIKEIAKETSFTRTSIYNYFSTKEEIFLALLQKEYECWTIDLENLIENNETLTKEELANALARSLEKRELLLKIMSMNHYDMEENSTMDRLVEFKKSYGNSIKAVIHCLEKFCPQMTEEEIQDFIYTFFPFVYGIYPYAVVNQKQKEAMEKAGVPFVYFSIYEISYKSIRKMLGL